MNSLRKILSYQQATRLGTLLFSLFVLFHLSVIVGIIFFNYVPIDYLWGGRMQTKEELLIFEIISMSVMGLCVWVVLVHAGKVKMPRLRGLATVILWILVVLFLLNTIGNIVAKTTFEKFFTIVTAILALVCLRIAIEKPSQS
jgi:archaellum biogenesis protein FlaJ (TadC family)